MLVQNNIFFLVVHDIETSMLLIQGGVGGREEECLSYYCRG